MWSLTNGNQDNQSCNLCPYYTLRTQSSHPVLPPTEGGLLSPAIILDFQDLSDKIPFCFWHGNLFVFPNEAVGFRFLLAVIVVFSTVIQRLLMFSVILGLRVVFVIILYLCCFVFQTQLTPFLLLLQPTITSQQDRSFPLPSSS